MGRNMTKSQNGTLGIKTPLSANFSITSNKLDISLSNLANGERTEVQMFRQKIDEKNSNDDVVIDDLSMNCLVYMPQR